MKKIIFLVNLLFLQIIYCQNNALTFNGIDQQINTSTQQSNISFTTQNFTIEAWVKPAAFVGGTGVFEHTIIGNDNWNATNNFGYVLRTGGSRKLDFTFGQGNAWYSITSTNSVFTVDQWTHVAVVRNGATFTLYANGVQVAQQTFSQNMAVSTANLRIAENGNGSGRFFNGALDEIKIWNTARTVAEVRNDLATAATPLPAELIVYYKMDQTTGQTVVSETAVNLFAQYLPTAQVNSSAGFFRTYTFETTGNWTDRTKWKNGFTPTNLIAAGDIININANCVFNESTFNLPVRCVLNVNTSATLTMNESQNIVFKNYGTVNVFNILLYLNPDNTTSYFENYGILNISVSGEFKTRCGLNLKSGSVVNSNGYLGGIDATIEGYIKNNQGTLNNLQGANTDFIWIDNDGVINNNSNLTVGRLLNGSSNANAVFNNNAGILTVYNLMQNDALINNLSVINLLELRKSSNSINYQGATINNAGSNSTFRINESDVIFENQGTFLYQNLIENKGTFNNKSSGILRALSGGGPGSVRQFENLPGAVFTNQGTYIAGGDFNNGGSHANTGTRSGGGNFSDSLYTNPVNANLSPSENSGLGIGAFNFFTGLTNNGNINIEIGGLSAGSGHDSINVTGTATISGTLNASIINGYIPPIGTTDFTIISATTAISGTFATVVLPVATQGVVWSIIYSSTTVRLRAVVRALTNTFLITRCGPYTWPINNQTYTTSGNYDSPIPNSNITQRLALTILPASEVITTQTACGEFFWANNFTNYNQSGTYTGTTLNCVTQKLILTIIPTTQNVTTQTACNSFTWANNGQTYTQSGSYTGTTTNCITERLNLTIIPASDNIVFDSACTSYTWANNGQTYTQSGIYTGTTTNCVTQKLNLTIYPFTNETVTVTSCGGYFWEFADESYTTSGSYIYTDGCDTKNLNLTITPLNEIFTTITACASYTWAHNGETYTTSGIYDGYIDECNIQKLNLTINSTTWDGTSWSNLEPDATKRAIFTGNYTATTNLTACSVFVSGTANVVFPSNFNLTVNNEVMVSASSTLTFENNSNLIQINATINTGNITYKRNATIKRLDYTYWSSPVSNQNLLDFTPQTLPNRFYTFSEINNSFVQVASPAATNFEVAKGYSLRAPNTFSTALQTFIGEFKGVPNNGDFLVPVTTTASPTGAVGFNLIGNPYPSTIDATRFLQANLGSVYFWTHQSFYDANGVLQNGGVSNYASMTLAGSVSASAATVVGGNNVLPNGFIQAGQGFMFLTSSNKNVNFTNSMRAGNNDGQFFRAAQPIESNKLWLNLTNNNGTFSQTMVAYLPNTTTSFDDGYDAKQLNSSGNVLSSTIGNESYTIQSRGSFVNSDVVKLNLNIATAGNYTISRDNTNGIFSNEQDFFMKDNLLGLTHNIKQSSYNFVSDSGTFANRFEIVYQSALSNNNNVFENANVIVFEQNGLLNISSTDDLKAVKVFDVQGRNIFEVKDINSKTATLNGFRPQQQVLLLQITNLQDEVVTKKVVF